MTQLLWNVPKLQNNSTIMEQVKYIILVYSINGYGIKETAKWHDFLTNLIISHSLPNDQNIIHTKNKIFIFYNCNYSFSIIFILINEHTLTYFWSKVEGLKHCSGAMLVCKVIYRDNTFAIIDKYSLTTFHWIQFKSCLVVQYNYKHIYPHLEANQYIFN